MTSLYLFFITSLMLNLTPGNDMLYVISRTLSRGTKGGLISALGIFIGGLVHILSAMLGLSILIANSPFLFELVKYAGAGYLIYLGLKGLLSKRSIEEANKSAIESSNLSLLKQGIVTNVLNPKVAIFFLSFLPQFIDPASTQIGLELLALGLWFDIQGTLVLIAVVLIAGSSSRFIKQRPVFVRYQEKVTGLALIAIGLRLALSSSK